MTRDAVDAALAPGTRPDPDERVLPVRSTTAAVIAGHPAVAERAGPAAQRGRRRRTERRPDERDELGAIEPPPVALGGLEQFEGAIRPCSADKCARTLPERFALRPSRCIRTP